VGLGLYLAFLAGLIGRSFRALSRAAGDDRAVLLLGLVAAVVALVVKSLSTWFLNTYTVTLWLGVILGTLDALSRPDRELPVSLR
jgi:type IV secretory pathway TrbD component